VPSDFGICSHRSAMAALPYSRLNLLIVDEAHETTSGIMIALDMARSCVLPADGVRRAERLLLVSATLEQKELDQFKCYFDALSFNVVDLTEIVPRPKLLHMSYNRGEITEQMLRRTEEALDDDDDRIVEELEIRNELF
ncbi:hypothetical protein PFISCL1PPCAC_21712, partial [Pristionchus fissidentatus]